MGTTQEIHLNRADRDMLLRSLAASLPRMTDVEYLHALELMKGLLELRL